MVNQTTPNIHNYTRTDWNSLDKKRIQNNHHNKQVN